MSQPNIEEVAELEALRELTDRRASHIASGTYWGTDSNNLWIAMLMKALARAGGKHDES